MTIIPDKRPAKVYSAPRRYDLATILMVSTVFALVFGVSRYWEIGPAVPLHIAGLSTAVALAQAILFGGKKPRLASGLVGILYMLAVCLYVMGWEWSQPWWKTIFTVSVTLSGGAVGYCNGAMVGGVFLLAEKLRTTSGSGESD